MAVESWKLSSCGGCADVHCSRVLYCSHVFWFVESVDSYFQWQQLFSPATSATLVFSCHHLVWNPKQTAVDKLEEGEDDVKSACRLRPGRHMCYNGRDKGLRPCEGKLTSKTRPQFGLQAATCLHEAGIARNRRSAIWRWIRSRAFYTPPVTLWELAMPEVVTLQNSLHVHNVQGHVQAKCTFYCCTGCLQEGIDCLWECGPLHSLRQVCAFYGPGMYVSPFVSYIILLLDFTTYDWLIPTINQIE